MPPKPKITEKMILDTAFSIVRMEGEEKLTVRRIAEKPGCSTQPVLIISDPWKKSEVPYMKWRMYIILPF